MAKFKVGDKVRVIKDLENIPYNGNDGEILSVTDEMLKRAGTVVTIAGYTPRGNYKIEDSLWVYCDEMLEDTVVSFTKADLKDGMVVEYANGQRRLFCNSVFMSELAKFSDLHDFNDDLTCCRRGYEKEYTINKVYDTAGKTFDSVFKDYKLTLIWERPEECKEMTVEEIEKILGHKVKVVGSEGK